MTEDYGSSRIHCYQYYPFLKEDGFDVKFIPPSSTNSERFFKKYSNSKYTIIRVLSRFFYWYVVVMLNRALGVLLVPFYDVIYIQRGVFKYDSPAFLEKIICYLSKVSIFHFDDAIYIDNPKSTREKVQCVDLVLADTNALCEYAKKYNNNVQLWEDAIDLNDFCSNDDKKRNEHIIIGWVGNPVGFRYLYTIESAIKTILDNYNNVKLQVVSNIDIQFNNNISVENILWSPNYNYVNDFDIGIMPLIGDEYDRAKGGYKILEYMASSIPFVCSKTADNFIEDGDIGFIANSEKEWIQKLSILIDDENRSNRMGKKGRRLVEERFDLNKKGPRLSKIIKNQIQNNVN